MRGVRARRRLAWALGAAVCTIALMPVAASAATYRVDDTGDDPDANPGNNVCATAGAVCTLRAALEEANAHGGFDEIRFRSPLVDQEITILIAANGFYPTVDEAVKIDGCSSDPPGRKRPCVGLQADDGTGIPFLVGASDVTIKGLAIGNAFQGIQSDATADDLTVRKNWFGLDINGGANPLDQIGVRVTGDRARIGGGGGSAHRNLFANSETGVYITKGDDTKVQGNWFGLEDDGSPIPNDQNIKVVKTDGDDPTGTLIGGRVTSGQATTTKCDGVCNVISAASDATRGHGINLGGEDGSESPSVGPTTIAGNFIGLDRFGTQDRGNAADGINTSFASGVTIGGSSSRDRNFIGGNGSQGIDSLGRVTVDPVLKRNWIGLSSSGATPIADNFAAVRLEFGKFARNRVAGDGSDPDIGLSGNSAGRQLIVKRNKFGICVGGANCGFGEDAIRAAGDNGSIYGGPNPGDGNTIANAGRCGLFLNGRGNNTIQGNYIGTDPAGADRGNQLSGICLTTFGNENENNVIGGPGAAQNAISFNGDHAIELDDTGSPGNLDNNEIKHNRGRGNGDIFIELIGTANDGITPPDIDAARTKKASGSGLPTGQKVRVYKTRSPDGLNRIDRFLCADTVGTGGNWSCTYADSVPIGALVTATRTDATGNTSALAAFRTVPFPP